MTGGKPPTANDEQEFVLVEMYYLRTHVCEALEENLMDRIKHQPLLKSCRAGD